MQTHWVCTARTAVLEAPEAIISLVASTIYRVPEYAWRRAVTADRTCAHVCASRRPAKLEPSWVTQSAQQPAADSRERMHAHTQVCITWAERLLHRPGKQVAIRLLAHALNECAPHGLCRDGPGHANIQIHKEGYVLRRKLQVSTVGPTAHCSL